MPGFATPRNIWWAVQELNLRFVAYEASPLTVEVTARDLSLLWTSLRT